MNPYNRTEHIVVVGAGYAGLPCSFRLAQQLSNRETNGAQITLINAEPRQELTSELFRTLRTGKSEFFNFLPSLKRLGIRFMEGQVTSIKPKEKSLVVRGEKQNEIKYDHLVLATGLKTKIPQIENINTFLDPKGPQEKRVFPIRNNIQVQQLRLALKRLSWNSDTRFSKDVFVVIVGAGTTGLEVAGELAHLRGSNSRARIILVDEKTGLLDGFSPIAKKLLKKELARLRIETVLGSPAVAMNDKQELHIQNGQVIPWDLLVLCTGGRPSTKLMEPFNEAATPLGLKVKKNLQIEGFPDHYAIGDIANISRPAHSLGNQSFLPKTAQFAVQEGHFVADLLSNKISAGVPAGTQKFSASDWGYMVSLGPYSGFGRMGPEIESTLGKFLSPFVAGPAVNQLKKAARIRYLATLRLDSWAVRIPLSQFIRT